ncbi:MAG: alpha/beta hydrolase [Erythrobacter sp.]
MSQTHPIRLRLAILASLAGALTITPLFAQQSDRPSRECVREIRQLCAGDRSQMRGCLRERYSELSQDCASELRARMQAQRGTGERPQARAEETEPAHSFTYGEHERQRIDVFSPSAGGDGTPLVVFIHGGGWAFGSHQRVQAKPAHFTNAGYAFASAGYRVLPDAPVEEQAADVGAALQALRTEAGTLGFDPDRIVLMGHSAGAHLAALVATDPRYAGEAFGAILGVVLLDGAGYDVASQMARRDNELPGLYQSAFGSDPERHAALSPLTHVGGNDAPDWLVLFVEERAASRAQSEQLADRLVATGSRAEAMAISNTDHGRMNRELGTPVGAQQTEAVDAFLARVLR